MNRKFSTVLAVALLLALSALAGPATAAPMLSGDTSTAAAGLTPVPEFNPRMKGHIVWEGRSDALQQLPLTLHLRQLGANEPAEAEYNVVTDKDGTFIVNVGQLPIGKYEWRVKGAQFLSNSGEIALDQVEVTSVDMGLMRAGDIAPDNVVNARDFSLLTGSFNKSPKDPGYNPNADFTGDDVVNISDFRLLAAHFGQRGN